MCTTYPRISAIFADGSRALCRCTLLFCSLFPFLLGKQSFQYVSGETHTYTLSHQGRTTRSQYQLYQNIVWLPSGNQILIQTKNRKALIKAHVGKEGHEQAKEGTAGEAYIKQIKSPLPRKVAKNKIQDFTINKWTSKWNSASQYKLTKFLNPSHNKNKAKYIQKMNIHNKHMDQKCYRS